MTVRVSIDSSGNQGNGHSWSAGVSNNGRYVAFTSEADNLVPNDTNGVEDGFLHNRQTGVTERISVDLFGNQGNGTSVVYGISGDGRYITLGSYATNFVQGDTNGFFDAFVHDHLSGVMDLVSVDSSGVQANASLGSYPGGISGDGRFVAFYSNADNLVAGDTNGFEDVFVRDRSCSDLFVNYCTPGTSATRLPRPAELDGHRQRFGGLGLRRDRLVRRGSEGRAFLLRPERPAGELLGQRHQLPVRRAAREARSALHAGNGTIGRLRRVDHAGPERALVPDLSEAGARPDPGKKLQIQFWYRDPLTTSNQSTSFSDAIEVTPCP